MAATLLRRALRLLGSAPAGAEVDELVGWATATLVHSEAERGHVERAIELLDGLVAAPGLAGRDAVGVLHNQRGLLQLRRGQVTASIASFDQALLMVDDEPSRRCTVLLNRSAAHLYSGHARLAGDDLERCVDSAARHGLDVLEAKARHNLGYLALLRRDLPAALRELATAHAALSEVAPGYCGIIRLDRGRVLRDAGLLDEAEAELDGAVEALTRYGLDQDLAEAELVRAEVALLGGRVDQAKQRARAVGRRFRRRGNHTWGLLAELVILQAERPASRAAAAARLPAARGLADGLAAAGLAEEARLAGLAADRIELTAGGRPAVPPPRRGDRVATRAQIRVVRIELAGNDGDRLRARREARRGLADLQRHRAGLGSYDLQTGAGLYSRRLIESALREALREGRPSTVYAWAERARGVSLRMAPVRPPEDPELAAALAEVRAVRLAQRTAAQLAGARGEPGADTVTPLQERSALARRLVELRLTIRNRSWQVAGAADRRDVVVGLTRLRAELAGAGGALVSFVAAEGQLYAVVASRSAARLVRVGPAAPVGRALTRVRMDLDAMARANLPPRIRPVVAGSLDTGLRLLDTLLWQPVARGTGDGPLVVVPTGTLATVPWTALPGLHGRPVTVAPSASWWSAAERLSPGPAAATFAAGPGLVRAEEEIRGAARHWRDSRILTGAAATSGRVLTGAAASGVLHLAAHGRHEHQNSLFSSIDLHDGPLFGYDLAGVGAMAAHVVLSACDVGQVTVRAGDEPLGMAIAFLHAGARSVVASPARVGDDIACRVMTDYHRRLGTGAVPAEALADSLARARAEYPDRPAPFVAIGAAW